MTVKYLKLEILFFSLPQAVMKLLKSLIHLPLKYEGLFQLFLIFCF